MYDNDLFVAAVHVKVLEKLKAKLWFMYSSSIDRCLFVLSPFSPEFAELRDYPAEHISFIKGAWAPQKFL